MNIKFLRTTFFTLLFIISASAVLRAQNPFIPKYDAVKRSERCFTVTWPQNNQFGSVWWADKVDFTNDTTFNFVVYMGNKDGGGADGLSFVIHQDPRDTITNLSETVTIGGAGTWNLSAATGDDGGGLGYAMHTSRVGPNTIPGPHGPGDDPENHKIQPSVAVEIDTYNNGDVQDGKSGTDGNSVNQPNSPFYGWDHTSVIYNGDLYSEQQQISDAIGNTDRILPLKPSYVFGTANNADGSSYHNIEDDNCYTFQIRWEVNNDGTQNLQLWADIYDGTTNTSNLQMIMNHTDDMINKVFGGNTIMRFGFTGSTGGLNNEQTICLLGENLSPFAADDYVSMEVNTSKVIDVESNDNDPDNDQLHVPVIIDYPFHGSAVIFDSLGINFLRYTPNQDYVGKDSLTYVTCDVNSTKCYAKCDTAFVYIRVGCEPFDIEATPISANIVCSDSVPSNGSATAIAYLSRVIWYEGFEDLSNNTTSDNGTSGWSFTKTGNCTSNGDIIRVDTEQGSKLFRVQNSGCEVEWKTSEIDISAYKDKGVDVTLNVWERGRMESSDYLKVYYQLDGGPLTEFGNGIHEDDISGVKTPYIDNVIGDKLQIIVLVKNNHGNEEHFWDNLIIKGEGPTIAGVEFNWYEGQRPSAASVYTGVTGNGLNDGIYTVIATDVTTGCFSNPVNVTIDSAGYNISGGYIEQLAPFTNCALPYDGALGAGIIDGADTITNGYIFEWYHQEDPKISSFIKRTGPEALNLESREYSVIITDNTTGCDTTINGEVVNEVIIPTVNAITTSHVISCTDQNTGVAEANIGGNTLGYDFEWYAGPAVGAGPPDYTTASVSTLAPGIYTVQAIDNSTSCTSVSTTVTVIDQSIAPDLLVTVNSEQTSCDPLAPTGDFSAAVNESGIPTTAGYSFYWYKGANDVVPARTGYSGGSNVDALEAGIYRLVAIADGTNCTSYLDTLIQGQTVTPPDISLTKVDVTHCVTPNGSINISVTGDPADFDFALYKGFGVVTDSLLLNTTNTALTGLAVGNYTIVAIDKITKCETNPATITIDDATILPSVSFVSQDQVSCDNSNLTGLITATVGTGAPADYTFNWFEDDLSGAAITPDAASDGAIISALDSGVYALSITSNTSQCNNIYYPSVDIGIVIPVADATSVGSTYCGTAVNGELHGTGDALTAGYSFEWFSVASNANLTATTADVTNVAPGDYLLTAINNTTACRSGQFAITVDDIRILPSVSFVSQDQVSCDNSNLTGLITATVGTGAPADYTFNWFEDDLSGAAITPDAASDGAIISALDSGVYALSITSNTSQCNNIYYPSVDIGIVIPVADATSVGSTYCGTAVNGELHGTGDALTAGYSFEWFSVASNANLTATTADVTNVAPGDYLLTAINNTTACRSGQFAITVDDIRILPSVSFVSQDQVSCDNSNLTGLITATVGTGAPADYTFNWFEDDLSGAAITPDAASDGAIISALDSGVYALSITSNTSQCNNIYYPSVDIGIVIPVADATSVGSTYCGTAVNGELHGTGDALTAGYSFEWFSVASNANLTATTADVTNVAPGDYLLTAINNTTACRSGQFAITVDDIRILPSVSFVSQDQVSCDNSNLTGLITATVGTGAPADYTFNWFEDDLSGAAITPDAASDGAIISALDSGVYALSITSNTSQCNNIYYPSVDIGIVIPVADATSVGSTYCGTAVNGELHGTGDALTAGYSFEWFSVASNANLTATTADVTNVAPGDYLLTAINNTTACRSGQFAITVDDIRILPSVSFVSQDQVSCDNSNLTGLITATVGTGAPADYTFNWFEDDLSGAAITPDAASDGAIISALDSGVYALSITSNTSQCNNIYYPSVDIGIVIPVADATSVGSTYCGTAVNGELHGTGDALTAGYSFEWFSVASNANLTATTADVTNVAPGDYLLTAINNTTACRSGQFAITVDDIRILPSVSFVSQDQVSCDNSNLTGLITATVGTGAPADYTFNWFEDDLSGAAITPDAASDGAIISALDSGVYALSITSNTSQCNNIYYPSVDIGIVIPVADATSVGSTYCGTAVNGELHGTGDALTAGYSFEWFSVASNANLTATTADVTNVAPGDYLLTAINNTTACRSGQFAITVDDIRILPSVSFVSQDQVSCDNSNLTGLITATVGTGAPADYTFNWFEDDLSGAAITPDAASDGAIISALDSGVYALSITSNTSQCNNIYYPSVDIGIVIPVADATSVGSTYCGTAVNGELHGTGDALTAGYSFEWFSVASNANLTATTADVTNVAPGDYLLTAINNTTACRSGQFAITVDDIRILPSVSFVSQDQVSCDNSNLTGLITATVGTGAPADYTFNWFEDDLSGAAITPDAASDGAIISALDSGVYALSITSNTSQCNNIYYPSVDIGIVIPVADATSVGSTYCGTAVNGELHGTGDALTAGYSFEWFSVASNANLTATTADVTNVAPGDYLLTAINNTTACRSGQFAITVDDFSIIPTAVLSLTNNSSCDPTNPNGELQVTSISNEANPLSAYEYLWYLGSSAGTQLGTADVGFPLLPDSSQIIGLVENTYALVLRNKTTNCSNEIAYDLIKINNIPVIDGVNVTDASQCAEPFLSGADVTSVTDPIGTTFTYTWINEDVPAALPINTSTLLDNAVDAYALPPGNYSVVVENEFLCQSDPVTFEIKDISVTPVFSLAANNNTSCEPTLFNGSLKASRLDNSYTISTYEWFAAGVPSVYPTLADSIHHDLPAGTYSVIVTDATTQCTSTEFAIIDDLMANNPLIDTVYTKDLVSCLNPNGEIGLQISPLQTVPYLAGDNRTYTFYAENNTSLADTTAASVIRLKTDHSDPDTVKYLSMNSGSWTALVVDDFTHCVSAPLRIDLDEAPGVVIQKLDSILPLTCDGTGVGAFQFGSSSTLNPDPTGAGFTYSWEYWGPQFAGPAVANPGTIVPASSNSFKEYRNDLTAGYYTVSVFDNFTGCTASDTFYLPVYNAPPSVLLTKIDAKSCAPGDGQIQFRVDPVMDATNTIQESGPAANYDVLLFSGNSVAGTELKRVTLASYFSVFNIHSAAAAPYDADLPPGMYTLVTVENSTPNKCYSDPSLVEVELDISIPTISATVSDDISCNGSGTGILTGSVLGHDGNTTDFDYEWFAGSDTTGANLSVMPNPEIISNKLAGIYTVKITDTSGEGNGCRYKKSFDLPKSLVDRQIVTPLVLPNNNCVGFDGSIQITNIEEYATDVGVLPGGYENFTLMDATFTPLSANNSANAFSGLENGQYYLRSRHVATGCQTNVLKVAVNDNTSKPAINLVVNSLDYGCNPGAADGQLEVDIVGNQNVADYQFEWYQGNSKGTLVSDAGNPFRASNLTANNATQQYVIIVEDINGANIGCIDSIQYTLVHQATDVTIALANLARSDQDICAPNGDIIVNQILEDDGSGPIATPFDYTGLYDVQLLDLNQAVINTGTNPYALFNHVNGKFGSDNIPAGTYFVRAANAQTGCGFGQPTQFVINDVSTDPSVIVSQTNPDFACLGGAPTGELTPIILGGTDSDPTLANFSVSWLLKGTATSPTVDAATGRATDLAPGEYTITVIDNTGVDTNCETKLDYTVTSDRHVIALTGNTTDQTQCIDNGTAVLASISEDAIAVPSPYAGWNLALLNDNKADITATSTWAGTLVDPFTNMADGTYFLRVQNDATKCYSDPYQLMIDDVSTDPSVVVSQTNPDFACLGGAPTGELTPIILGGTDSDPTLANFSVSWLLKGTATPPTVDAATGRATDLAPGEYTITVIDNTGLDMNCETKLDYTVTSDRHVIALTGNTTDQTQCIDNGTAVLASISEDAIAVPSPYAGWNLALLNDNKADITATSTWAGTLLDPFTDMAEGTYFLRVQNDATKCYSDPYQLMIDDVSTDPSVVVSQTNPDFACLGGAPTGELTPIILGGTDTDPTLANFSVSWLLKGTATSPTVDAATGRATDLAPGEYTITVIDNTGLDMNCETKLDYTVTSDRHVIALTGNTTDQTQCIDNGTAVLASISEDAIAVPSPYAGWNLALLDDNKTDITATSTWAGTLVDPFTNMADGTYFLRVQNDATKCYSDPYQLMIDDVSTDPSVVVSQTNPDFACLGGAPTGELTPIILGGTDSDPTLANFSVSWLLKGTATSPTVDAATGRATDLAPGEYTITVIDNTGVDTNCETKLDYTVTSDRHVIALTGNTTDQTQCIDNGTAVLASISEDAIAVPSPYAGWNLALLNDNKADITATSTWAGTLVDPFTNMADGTYFLRVQNDATKCYSDPYQLMIDDVSTDPSVVVSQTNPDFACLGGAPTGELTPIILGGTDSDPTLANFSVSWLLKGTATPPTVDAATGRATDLAPGEYTITVIDNTGLDMNCETKLDYTVTSDRHVIALTGNTTDQTQCIDNGTAVLASISEDAIAVPSPYAGWNLALLNDNKADITATSTWAGTLLDPFTDMAEGTYFLRVQNDATKCYSDPYQLMIDDVSTDPSVVVSQTNPDFACLGGAPTGELTPIILGGTDTDPTLANFSVSWLLKGTATSPTVDAATGRATDLAPGEYTITVIDNTGLDMNCETKLDYTVTSDRHVIALTGNTTDQTQCIDNGTAVLASISEDAIAVPSPYAGWNLALLDDNKTDITATSTWAGTLVDPFTNMADGTYFLRVQNDATKCYSDPYQLMIDDVSTDPSVVVSQTNPDFACLGGAPTGELTPIILGGTDTDPTLANFSVSWLLKGTATPPTVDAATGRATDLAPGEYTITVIDNTGLDMNCETKLDYTVTSDRHVIALTGNTTDQTQCIDNGTAVLASISEDAIAVPSPYAGWNLALLDDNKTDITATSTWAGTLVDPFTNMADGTYFLRVQNDATKCYSDPYQLMIDDVSTDPSVVVSQTNPDFACLGGAPTGELTPIILGGTDTDPTLANFSVSWLLKGTATSPTVDAATSRATDLAPGEYTITVIDNTGLDMNCETKLDYTVTSDRHVIALTGNTTDQTQCIDNGTAVLASISEDAIAVPSPYAGWNLALLDDNKTDITATSTWAGTLVDPFTNMADGTYFLRVQNDATKCYSDPYQLMIDDVSTDPEVAIALVTPQYSLNPNPASWTGQLNTSAIESNTGLPDPMGYSYSWHKGLDTSTPSLGALDSIISLGVGDYTVVARSTSTNCESSYSAYVPYEYLEPTFNTYAGPKTVCAPDNGSIAVTNIDLAGNADLLSDYTFNWHHDVYNSTDVPDEVIPGNDTQTIYNNLGTGSYYAIAFENWLMVESLPVKIEVMDSTTNPDIVFDATNYQPLTSCDEATFADGQLAVDVYEDNSNPYLAPPPYNYSYTWYNGLNTAPANIIAGETNNIISSLPTGEYTVSVVNLGNNCQSESTFSIEDESITPIVIASQMSNTNCPIEIANGITSASVINSDNGHIFRWYEGEIATGNPIYEGPVWQDRPIGTYTVVAVDQQFGTCISEPVIIEVEDATELPTVVINEISPVTNCDPERPNGILSAVTQDGITGHTFDWYHEDQLYFTGPIASTLGLLEYKLVVTNDVTQCQTAMTSSPTQLFSAVPYPEVDILNELTSCNEPDGIVTASIGGSVTDHIFKYYYSNSGEEVTNYYDDYKLYNLDSSNYYVTAEDRATGCISDSTAFAIANETYYPEFEVTAEPSNCDEATGAADVVISDMTRGFKVYWRGDNGFESQQKELVYVPIGTYTVEVEGSDGCITPPVEVEVKGDVKIFNGVTPNDDGMNDYFKIVCLEHFPDNNVKIYNRAGLLVYEQDGYDIHSEKRFVGISNRGVSVIGKDLPIGTYFYIVDKNDGSKANVGYLELKR